MRTAVLLLLASCGRVGFDPIGTATGDGNGDSASPTCWDAWIPGPPTFTTPIHLGGAMATVDNEADPRLSADALTLTFGSNRGGMDSDIYVSTRSSTAAMFTTPVRDASLRSPQEDVGFALDVDTLGGWLVSERTGGAGAKDIWRADRSAVGQPYTLTAVPGLNMAADEFDATMSDDKLRLYFERDEGGAANDEIYLAGRPSPTMTFGIPIPVPVIGGSSAEYDPWLSPDETFILFMSDRTGERDFWFATRPSTMVAFSTPIRVPGLHIAGMRDLDPTLSRDGCELYFDSDRAGGVGALDLWRVTVVP